MNLKLKDQVKLKKQISLYLDKGNIGTIINFDQDIAHVLWYPNKVRNFPIKWWVVCDMLEKSSAHNHPLTTIFK